jgi:exodeoxyribonuclease VII large subunit
VPVQGEGAGGRIAAMINTASKRAECDVLIVSRGGGSLEDLWAFNEEGVARAIHACSMPVVSGVGHEIDFTIADFVADMRAPTPTGAAELVTPDSSEWLRALSELRTRIVKAQARLFTDRREQVEWCVERMEHLHPARMLRDRAQRIDELEARLGAGIRLLLHSCNRRNSELLTRLHQRSPAARLQNLRTILLSLQQRTGFAIRQQLGRLDAQLGLAARSLHNVSPLATLERGYAVLSDAEDGKIVTSISQVRVGQTIRAQLADGHLLARVAGIKRKAEK